MKKVVSIKKLTSWVLAMALLLICIIPADVVLADETENTPPPSSTQVVNIGGETENATDGVKISKTIEGTEKENYFDITLKVETERTREELLQTQKTDVVLVMDISNTMNTVATGAQNNETRLDNAKAAAKTFVEDYNDKLGSSGRLALVTFNRDAKKLFGLTSATEETSLKSKIDTISAPAGWDIRWTNIEGGLQLASNLLTGSDAKHKFIILLTDGFPTTYVRNTNSAGDVIGYCPHDANSDLKHTDTNTSGTTKEGTDGYFYNFQLNDGESDTDGKPGRWCLYGTSYSDKGADRAQNKATSIKGNDINIFTVGVDVNGQSIQQYKNQDAKKTDENRTKDHSVIDTYKHEGKNYTVDTYPYIIENVDKVLYDICGNPTQRLAGYELWLAANIAGGNDLNVADSVRYCRGNNSTNLQNAYDKILQQIKEINIKSIEDTYMTSDPMGDNVEFQYFYDKDGHLAKDQEGNAVALEGTHEANGENDASYTEQINWSILKSGYKTSTPSEGKTIYTYQLKYRVRLKNESRGFEEGKEIATNGTTTLAYKVKTTVNNVDNLFDRDPLEFKVPSVEGYLGNLSFKKIDSLTGEGMNGVQFNLVHEGSDCSVCGGDASINLTATSTADGTVTFDNIPSGHEYTLTETTPDGYADNQAIYNVTVAYDKVTVMDASGEVKIDTDDEGNIVGDLVIENTPNRIAIEGTKNWDDFNDHYELRPDSIDLKLFKSVNGSTPEELDVEPVWDKTDADAWQYKFKNLPEAENGDIIDYSVEETALEDYKAEYDEQNEFIITNTLVKDPSKGKLQVRKQVTSNEGAKPGLDAKYKFNLNVKPSLDARDVIQNEIDDLKNSIKDIQDDDIAALRAQMEALEARLAELTKENATSVAIKLKDLKDKLEKLNNSEQKQKLDRRNFLRIEKRLCEETIENTTSYIIKALAYKQLASIEQELAPLENMDFSQIEQEIENVMQAIEALGKIDVKKIESQIAEIRTQIEDLRENMQAQLRKINIQDRIDNLEELYADIDATIVVKFTPLTGEGLNSGLDAKEIKMTTSSDEYDSATKSYNIPFELLESTGYEIEIFANREVGITYSVTETEYPTKYYNKTFVTVNDASEIEAMNSESLELNTTDVDNITFRNDYYKENLTAIRGVKVWSDSRNKFNTRPQDVTLKLYKSADGENFTEVAGVLPSWANKSTKSDIWMWEYTNLPLYENNTILTYKVEEVDVDDNYSMRQEGNVIVNKLNKGEFGFDVQKIVTDEKGNNAKPDSNAEFDFNVNIKATNVAKENAKEQLEILKEQLNELKKINKETIEAGIASIKDRVKKLLEDVAAGKITRNEIKVYMSSLEAKIKELRDIDVTELQKKIAAIAGMIAVLEKDITANYQEELDMIIAQINELQNIGIDELKVDGETIVNQAELLKYMFEGTDETLKVTFTDVADASNKYEYVLTKESNMYDAETKSYNIPFKLKDGQKYTVKVEADRRLDIKYSVEETDYVDENYNKTTVKVGDSNPLEGTKTSDLTLQEDVSPSIVFTNDYYRMKTVDIEGTKVWSDNHNMYNTRPDSITLQLTKTVAGTEEIDTVVAGAIPTWTNNTADNDTWNWKFTGLPMYEDKEETKLITYTVKEVDVDEDYTVEYTTNQDNTIIIENKLIDDTIIGSFNVTKRVSGLDSVVPAVDTMYKFKSQIVLPIIVTPNHTHGAEGEIIPTEGYTYEYYPVTVKVYPVSDPQAQPTVYEFTNESEAYDSETNTYEFEFSLKKDETYRVEVISHRDILYKGCEIKYNVTETEYERAYYRSTLVSVNQERGTTTRTIADRVLDNQREDAVVFTNVYGEVIVPTTNPPENPTEGPSEKPTEDPTEEPVSTTNPPEGPTREPSETKKPGKTAKPSKDPGKKPTSKPVDKGETYFADKTEKDTVVKDNKYNAKGEDDKTPSTSDNYNLVSYYGLMLISALGLTFMVFATKRKKYTNN